MQDSELISSTTTLLTEDLHSSNPTLFAQVYKTIASLARTNPLASECLNEIHRCLGPKIPPLPSPTLSQSLDLLASPSSSKYQKQALVQELVSSNSPPSPDLLQYHLLPLLTRIRSPTVHHLMLRYVTPSQFDAATARLARDLTLSDSLRVLVLRWRADECAPPLFPGPFDSLNVQTVAAHACLRAPGRPTAHLVSLFDFCALDFYKESPGPGPRTAAVFSLLSHALGAHKDLLLAPAAALVANALLLGGPDFVPFALALVELDSRLAAPLADCLEQLHWPLPRLLPLARALLPRVDPRPPLRALLACAPAPASEALLELARTAVQVHAPRLLLPLLEQVLERHAPRHDPALRLEGKALVRLARQGGGQALAAAPVQPEREGARAATCAIALSSCPPVPAPPRSDLSTICFSLTASHPCFAVQLLDSQGELALVPALAVDAPADVTLAWAPHTPHPHTLVLTAVFCDALGQCHSQILSLWVDMPHLALPPPGPPPPLPYVCFVARAEVPPELKSRLDDTLQGFIPPLHYFKLTQADHGVWIASSAYEFLDDLGSFLRRT